MRTRILPILMTVLIAGLAFIFIHQVLAAPQLDANTGIPVDEGAVNTTITASNLKVSDPENSGAVFTYTILTPPQHGTLSGGGSFTQAYIDANNLKYTHNGSETIADSFEFNVTNGVTIFITGTFQITINPVNDPPNAVPDVITVIEAGTAITLSTPLSATSVISNDTDAENDTLTVITHTQPSHASAFTLNADGTFSYTHNGSENHSDSFTYTICDDGTPSECDTTTVTIIIIPLNDPPSLTISGTPTEDQTLTSNLSDDDGLPDPADIDYQWQRSNNGTTGWTNIGGATNDTYTLDDPDVNKFVRLTATYTDTQNTLEKPESNVIGPIANINDTPSLTIIGAPTENVTLIANLIDDDGISGTVSFQWQRSATGAAPWTPITGATNSTYTLDDPDVGQYVRVRASYIDDHGEAENPTSAAIGPVANVNDIPSLTISGTPTEDETLSAVLMDNDGLPDPAFISYQWQRSDNGTSGWEDIDGAISSTFTLDDPDVGKYIRVTATYTDIHGTAENPASDAVGPIANINDVPTLTISGIETEDETLTAILSDDDGLPGTIGYQWQRSNNGTSGWQNISGAANSTYTLGDFDAFRYVRVTATYTDNHGTLETPVSPSTGAIVNVNDAPVAVNDNVFISEGHSFSINVLANDYDVDLYDTLSASIVTAPSHAASYTLATNGSLQYTHNGYLPGSTPILDTIEYKICDNGTPALCATAFVNITITPVDDPPTAVPDTFYLLEGATVTGNVKTNDFDEEGHPFVVITPAVSPPSHAAPSGFSLQNSGAFSYKHDGSENHSDSFRYRVCETLTSPLDRCSETTVTLVITPVNDAPVTSPDFFTVPRSETLDTLAEPGQKSVLANDIDPEGDTMTVNTTPVTPPIYAASFTLKADGSFIYVHNDTSNLPDSFKYRVCDNGTPSRCSEETVTITIGPRPTSFVYLPTILNNYSPDEPNNTPCTAYPIGLNSQNNFMPNDTEDWYRITLPSQRNLSIQVTNFLLEGDLIVYRSANCNNVTSGEVKNDGTSHSSKTVNWANAPAGTYFIRVYTANPNPNAQAYKLIVNAP